MGVTYILRFGHVVLSERQVASSALDLIETTQTTARVGELADVRRWTTIVWMEVSGWMTSSLLCTRWVPSTGNSRTIVEWGTTALGLLWARHVALM